MLFVHVCFELATRIYMKENGWQNSSAERHISAGKYLFLQVNFKEKPTFRIGAYHFVGLWGKVSL